MTEPTYSLTGLSVNDVNVVIAALVELPIKVAGDTFLKIRAQLVAATEVKDNQ